jgi:protein TonB
MFEQESFARKPHPGTTIDDKAFEEKAFDERNFPQKLAAHKLTSKSERSVVYFLRSRVPEDPSQQRLMLTALALLLVALCLVLYRDRNFWFPDGQETQITEPAETAPAASVPEVTGPAPVASLTAPASLSSRAPVASSRHRSGTKATASASRNITQPPVESGDVDPPPAVISNRTALPPLNVEVVAGDTHRTIRPGSDSVRVDLEPGAKPQAVTQPTTEIPSAAAPSASAPETTATLTSNAAERVQISADTQEVVRNPVKPGYPLLARQMKVQGSVILQALISKDGVIQGIHLISGPRILASAAEDAVRQWHFKPHFVNDEAVETQAKITVNFTISTN